MRVLFSLPLPLCVSLSLPSRSLSLSVSVFLVARLGLCEGDAAIFLVLSATVALKYSLFTFFLSASFILQAASTHTQTVRLASPFLVLLLARTPPPPPSEFVTNLECRFYTDPPLRKASRVLRIMGNLVCLFTLFPCIPLNVKGGRKIN